MNEAAALNAFAALSHKTRLAMLRLLVQAGCAGLSAGEIATRLNATPSRASFHLSALQNAGLITVERQARTLIYRPAFDGLAALLAFLMEDCCAGAIPLAERRAKKAPSKG